jgi:hypothetical protein
MLRDPIPQFRTKPTGYNLPVIDGSITLSSVSARVSPLPLSPAGYRSYHLISHGSVIGRERDQCLYELGLLYAAECQCFCSMPTVICPAHMVTPLRDRLLNTSTSPSCSSGQGGAGLSMVPSSATLQVQHPGVGICLSLGPHLVPVPTEVPCQQLNLGAGEQFGGGESHRQPDLGVGPDALLPGIAARWTPPAAHAVRACSVAKAEALHSFSPGVTTTARRWQTVRGRRRGGTRGSGKVSPLLPRPSFPHVNSNDGGGESRIAVLEHSLKPLKSGVGPHLADSFPASPGSRSTTCSDNNHSPGEGC